MDKARHIRSKRRKACMCCIIFKSVWGGKTLREKTKVSGGQEEVITLIKGGKQPKKSSSREPTLKYNSISLGGQR